MAFHVSCAECEYETRVESVEEALDRQVAHRRAYDPRHVLEFAAEGAH